MTSIPCGRHCAQRGYEPAPDECLCARDQAEGRDPKGLGSEGPTARSATPTRPNETAAPQAQADRAWLIEHAGTRPIWWSGDFSEPLENGRRIARFVNDTNDAKRFPTQSEAEVALAALHDARAILFNAPELYRATEHEWPSPQAQAREPLSLAQVRRLYDNSPQLHADVKSFAGFERVVRLMESVLGITTDKPTGGPRHG